MAKPHQRVIALVIALLFFAVSVISGVLVIAQIRQENEQAALIEELRAAGDSDVTSEQTEPNINQAEESQMLQGTKLQDYTPQSITELQRIDLTEGTGEEVQSGATVTAHYTGAVAADGTIFQSSLDMGQPIPFSLDGVIQGWTEGVPGMKVGGKRRLLIPAAMAYGANPPAGAGIPANADLVFDIEVVSVEQ